MGDKVDLVLSLRTEFNTIHTKFLSLLSSSFPDLVISNKLKNWTEYEPASFISEIKKQKIVIKLSDQSTWLEHFTEEKSKLVKLLTHTNQIIKEIDFLVYQLYDITEAEIGIID